MRISERMLFSLRGRDEAWKCAVRLCLTFESNQPEYARCTGPFWVDLHRDSHAVGNWRQLFCIVEVPPEYCPASFPLPSLQHDGLPFACCKQCVYIIKVLHNPEVVQHPEDAFALLNSPASERSNYSKGKLVSGSLLMRLLRLRPSSGPSPRV